LDPLLRNRVMSVAKKESHSAAERGKKENKREIWNFVFQKKKGDTCAKGNRNMLGRKQGPSNRGERRVSANPRRQKKGCTTW